MKKLALTLTVFSLSAAAFAQIDSSKSNNNMQYCAQMKDGILVVVDEDNQEISSDIKTENGMVIQSNGNIVKKDGVTTVLKDGECINTQGIVVRLTNTKATKQTETKTTAKQKP